jgi:hypothetical protein
MDGLYIVGGLDPAVSGHTAAVVMGVDRHTRMRYVLDVYNRSNTTPQEIRNLIKHWTEKYSIMEWRIEKNAFQLMLTQDQEIRQYLANRGVIFKEHFTQYNKWDHDFGVASMANLFGLWKEGKALVPPLIELPSTYNSEGMKALVEQLTTWFPDAPKGHKTDTVMALWFAEIRARELTDQLESKFHLDNPFLTPLNEEGRIVLDLDAYFARGYAGAN